ncbi:glycosyltransferase [Marinobacter sp. X15-166B]|uniref:glycosyltransferase n=1 Tax=Marinobacter sp. X15-166B TaxID=1897620 RepID=UPI00085C1E15|nr:glycosyltransferase [Marinobacter sp. X15-166B]OEY67987.1 glycosyl transferase [Marinobacter sp. X15-166B]
MNKSDWAIHLLLMVGLGGALVSSSVLATATLVTALCGLLYIKRHTLAATDWDKPKELRLMHFAFWFFVLVSLIAWVFESFTYEGGKNLGTAARFILFWPLVVAFTKSQLSARSVFIALALVPAAAIAMVAYTVLTQDVSLAALRAGRFGGGINAISFGNVALLGSVLTLLGAGYFFSCRNSSAGALLIIVGLGGLYVANLSETRSNLIALPLLLLLFMPLVKPKLRTVIVLVAVVFTSVFAFSSGRAIAALGTLAQQGGVDTNMHIRFELWALAWQLFVDNPLVGAGLGGFTEAARHAASSGEVSAVIASCCTGHPHNDLLNLAATRGTPGAFSWAFILFIPMVLFGKQMFNPHRPSAYLAIAGTMVSTGYLMFGLTEAAFDRSLLLTFYLLAISSLAAALYHELGQSYTRQRRVRVSATVITKNEEDHIAACLQSARLVADEIIVLDSGSSDRTVEIARQYADIVEVTDWPGFGVQKQRALEKASGDWVLSIDADERITPALAREINHRLAAPDADAYKLPWAVTIYGARLDFGRSGRAPLRLFRREGVRFSDALVHERILIPAGRTIKTLRGRLTHYTHRNFGHSLEKSAKYAWLGAQEKRRQGQKTRTMLYPAFRGWLTFAHVYLLRFGFLDGAVGYLTAVTYAQVTFNKYAGLWTLSAEKRKTNDS